VLNIQSLSNLNEMADLTGGTYLYTSRVSDIPDNLKKLVVKITHPYVIKLRAKSLKADDLPHVLEVSVNERDSAGKGQKTFVAVKVPVPRWLKLVIALVILVIIILIIVLYILRRIEKRKRMGITTRRCPECNNRMKDTWDSCPFCRYLPEMKRKKKKKKDG